MHEIVLFVEDFAHRQVINALVRRLAAEFGLEARLDWRNATRGYGQVVREFNTTCVRSDAVVAPRPI